MEIRHATMSDYQDAHAVQHAVIEGNHQYEYAENIRYPGTLNLVAVHNGAVVGFLSILLAGLKPDGPNLWQRLRPYLAFVGVLPELQGQHIGTELIRCGARIVVSQVVSGVWLECPESAAAFYEKVGFSRVPPEAVQQVTGLAPRGPVYYLSGEAVVS